MNTGQVISAMAHAGLIGWMLFGGQFRSEPLPFEVANVSVVSGAEYDAMVAATQSPETVTDVALPAPPTEEPPAPEVRPPQETPPERTPEPQVTETPPQDTVPEPPAPPQEAEVQDTVPDIAPPTEPTPPAPELSARPQQRPIERVTPEPVPAPPEPEAKPDRVVREEVTDQPSETPPRPEPEQKPTAPEESVAEIVPEAADPVTAAPKTSKRPPKPPARPAPKPQTQTQTAQKPDTETAVNDALAAALGNPGNPGGEAAQSSAPQLSGGERDGLISAISDEWTVDPGAASGNVTVVVRVKLTPDGKLAGSPVMVSATGGDQTAIDVAFRKARTAIIAAGRKGFDLPPEKYARWQEIEISFNPEKMRLQ